MDMIESLPPNTIFVFGSNAAGLHGDGTARFAYQNFGAAWGEGHGLHGQTYAIDMMSGLEEMGAEVRAFIAFAKEHTELRFLVTEIGCGVAGYTPAQVAPLFKGSPANVVLPEGFKAQPGTDGG